MKEVKNKSYNTVDGDCEKSNAQSLSQDNVANIYLHFNTMLTSSVQYNIADINLASISPQYILSNLNFYCVFSTEVSVRSVVKCNDWGIVI